MTDVCDPNDELIPFDGVDDAIVAHPQSAAFAYSLHDDLRGTGVHDATVTIEGGIDSRPHFAADLIARTHLDIHQQQPSQWVAEFEYHDPPS